MINWRNFSIITAKSSMAKIVIIFVIEITKLCFSLNNNNKGSEISPDISNKNPVVWTNAGFVAGTWNGAFGFKGIPYAEPPVGNLRWQPPAEKHPWYGIFKAMSFGNTCAQLDIHNSSNIFGSEDCLYLNVWTPTIFKKANLPVMVYIHGGLCEYFSGNWPTYRPSEEVARDTNMVYVSMNYRLNAFGFMTLDILSEASPQRVSGNYGLMDQLLALEWVQNNIRNFGGNPNLVTVAGHSCGGTSVLALLASPFSKGLFHRALIMSGSILHTTLSEGTQDQLVFLKKTGCSDLDCLLSLSIEKVINSIPWDVYPNWRRSDLLGLPTYQLLHGSLAVIDGYILPMSPAEAFKRGLIDVPVMIGTTAQSLDLAPPIPDIKDWCWDDYTKEVTTKMEKFPCLNVTRMLQLYPSFIETPEFQYTTMATDIRLLCPANELALSMSENFKSPVYRYIATASPAVPTSLLGFPFKARYAAHGWDIFAFFDTIKEHYKPTAADEDFKKIMRREIVHFAKTGRPCTKKWQTFPCNTAIISRDMETVDFYNMNQCAFWRWNDLYKYAW